jgi:hypothetical protein
MIDEKTGIDFPFFQSDVPGIFEGDVTDPHDPDFQAGYLKTMNFSEFHPHFDHVKDFEGNPWNYKIYGCYFLEDPTRKALGMIVEQGLSELLHTFDGCHCIRPPKGGSMRWSMHSWGLAEDWNAGSNSYGAKPAMDSRIVKCFAACGFEWGGLWSPPQDGMHFQLPWIKERTGPLAPVAWGT